MSSLTCDARPKKRDFLHLTAGLALGVLAGWYVLRDDTWEALWSALNQATPLPVLLALLLLAATQVIKTWRWQAILGRSVEVSFGQALRGLLIGQALNLLLPLRAGDFARVWSVGRHVPRGMVYTGYTVALEKVLDIIVAMMSALLLLVWWPWPLWLSRGGIITGIGSVGAITVGLIVAYRWQRRHGLPILEQEAKVTWYARLLCHMILPAMQLAREMHRAFQDGRLLWIAVHSVGVWLLGGATNLMVFWALGISVHWTAAWLVLIAIYLGVALPAPPTRAGVWHLLVVLALSGYGVASNVAVACGVLLHAVVVLPLLFAGGVAVWVNPNGSSTAIVRRRVKTRMLDQG
ncbi:MAG: flippase-like domain-containing protein [Anaerolineae bacterium]|nr:flippase-like domain-containing protein [Anaerolineae bacterium]MDW8069832.1 lysylphosphatidylglycerol synthase transmembrane domain-containing protein [Anaerolineae bacterium]